MGKLGLPNEICCALGVLFATASAAATVVGMLFQKVGLERKNNIIFTLGVLIFTFVKPGGQIIALFFAPVSLVAPLASVTILLNVFLVPLCRSEKLSLRGLLTSALLVIGCIGTTVAGSHDVKNWSQSELLGLATEKLVPTLVLCSLTAFSTLKLKSSQAKEGIMASWAEPSVAVAAFAPSAASALNNVMLKIFLTALSDGLSLWLVPLVGAVACSAFLQVWSTAIGVKLFDMLKYVPIQTAEQILVTTAYSMYVFEETPSNMVIFVACSAVISIGVLFSQMRPANPEGYQAMDDGKAKLIRVEGEVEDGGQMGA